MHRVKQRSGSHLTEDDEGDVSASVLSGCRVTNGPDAAVPVSACRPSTPSDCKRRRASYGRCDGDSLSTSELEHSRRVCVRKLFIRKAHASVDLDTGVIECGERASILSDV